MWHERAIRLKSAGLLATSVSLNITSIKLGLVRADGWRFKLLAQARRKVKVVLPQRNRAECFVTHIGHNAAGDIDLIDVDVQILGTGRHEIGPLTSRCC